MFSLDSQRRIVSTVQEYERLPRHQQSRARSHYGLLTRTMLVIADEDIEHGGSGDVNLAKATAYDGAIAEEGATQYTAYNPLFLKVFDGAVLKVEHCRLADAGKPQWVITQHWSATRILCTAPVGGITAGGSGSCTSVEALDGHFSPTTATVESYTANYDIEASMKLLAQLAWDDTGGNSYWLAYSADCT